MALAILRRFFFIVALLFQLILAVTNPIACIGIFIFLIGAYLIRQKRRGRLTYIKPGWFVATGIILTVILVMVVPKPLNDNETAYSNKQMKNTQIQKETPKEEDEAEVLLKKEDPEVRANQDIFQEQLDELANKYSLESVSVSRVIDGDTIELNDGRIVRLVGINTPESTSRTEDFGKEASKYTNSKLKGKQIWIQKDVSNTDRYGRLLRIIWFAIPLDDRNEEEIRNKMFNADLVVNGYAEPSTYPPDVKYSDFFVKFAREARELNSGLWGYGPYGTTKGDLDPKGSKNSNSAKPPPYSPTTKESYQNCTELRKVYPNGVPSDHPAYDLKYDRDKDNWACEKS
jgi:micrococcal nuclease